MFNMLATSRLCGNIYCFDQNYQRGKITLQVSVLMIEYLVTASSEFLLVQLVLYFKL